jgi:cell division protein FtsW
MVGSASSVVSISYYGSAWAIAIRECLWMVVGAAAFVAAARLETKTVRRLSTLLALGAIGLLVAVLAPGIGTSSFGASRWLGVGILRIQPSEIAKLALCLYAAHVIALRERTETEWGRVLRPIAVVTALMAVLVLAQPDMGTAAVVIAIALAIVVAAGAPGRAVAFTVLLLALGAACAAIAMPYRRARLLSFLNPQADPAGTGYQLLQSKTGLGAGHLFGLGLGNSREKWGLLPNPHTDFIFSIIGEELGLLGTLLVLGLLVALVLLGLRVARNAPDRFGQLCAVGISAWLGAETIVNVGAAIGILPITGIPLPFISFGGTSLVIDMAAVGFLVGIARRSGAPRRAPLRVVGPAPSQRIAVSRGASRPATHGGRGARTTKRHR